MISNPALLTHIHRVARTLRIHSNAGSTTTNLVGLRNGYGWVWHDPHGIGNIYALANMEKLWRVTYDTYGADGGAFVVHRPNNVIRFRKADCGLHYREVQPPTGNTVAAAFATRASAPAPVPAATAHATTLATRHPSST